MLEGSAAVPMYLQLKASLLADIRSGRYQQDEMIPSEPKLGELYGVSRITVRKAVSELVEEGYLVKRQGKGTFVRHHTIDRKIAYVSGFSESAEQAGFTVSSVLLRCEETPATDDVAHKLQVSPGQPVLYTCRKRMADGRPVMLENNYFPLPRFDFLKREDLTGSLYRLLTDKYGIEPIHPKETTLSMTLADADMARTMDTLPGTPFFKVDTFICDQDDNPIHAGCQYFLGELYTFSI